MKSLFTLLLLICSTFLFSQTHILTLPNDIKKEVDIVSESKKDITVTMYPEKKERTIRRTSVVSLIEKSEVPPLNYNDEGRVEFVEVVKMEGMTKDQLFTAAKVWMVNTYNEAESVIQSEDKDAGLIIGKGISTIGDIENVLSSNIYDIKYVIKIQFKEGRYRVSVTDINTNHAAKLANAFVGGKQPGIYDYKQGIKTIVSDTGIRRLNGKINPKKLKVRKDLIKHYDELFLSLKESVEKSKKDSDW